MSLCKICKHEIKPVFEAKIINKYNVIYYQCSHCKFMQTEEPYWLKEVYEESINISDTGIIMRNINLSKIVSCILYFLYNKNGRFIDFAGGYGIFTRLMRDIGFDFNWHDTFTENLVARGFEYDFKLKEDVELITSFESLEHFKDPIKEIDKMISLSKNLLFTTSILPNTIPKPNEWWYYGLEHGQHISFYSVETLRYIATKYKLKLFTNSVDVHLLTEKPISSFIFRLLLKASKFGLFFIVKKSMKSLTIDDMNSLIL